MISLSDFRTRAGWVALGPMLVGATFLWTGALKAISPHTFREHLTRLGWIPERLMSYLVPAAAGLETAWGLVLILGVMPAITLPLTAVLLVVFTGISWWGVKSGRTTDCGCYGGYVVPSIGQSVMLNGAFIALVLAAWIVSPAADTTAPWKIIVVSVIGIAFTVFAAVSQQFMRKNGRMMIETTPLKVGRRWSKRWGTIVPDDGSEMLISYLGPDCPYCKQWVRVLNAMDQAKGLPSVTGVVAASREELDTFIQNSGIRFPVVTVPQTLMSRLVWGVPTTVLVSAGRIESKWGGHMPPEFFQRFREAFFPKKEVGAGDAVKTAT